MAVLYWSFPGATYAALAIFIIASLTDLLDGKIARKYNLVTDFGKFADPLADKMLVTAAMLWFVEIGQMPAWMLLIVICREFAVSGLRMIASDKGRVIAAGWSGKVKTASTMVCVVLMFLPIPPVVNTLCVWVITLTTLWSGVEYFVKNRDVIASALRAAQTEQEQPPAGHSRRGQFAAFSFRAPDGPASARGPGGTSRPATPPARPGGLPRTGAGTGA